MTRKSSGLLLVAGLLLSACGMPAAGRASPSAQNVLSSEQMVAVSAPTAYDAVQRLRPEWLSTRGPSAITNLDPDVASVYLGGNHIGGPDALRNLRPDDVKELRYYEAGEASVRFGMGHSRGVIDVVMKGS